MDPLQQLINNEALRRAGFSLDDMKNFNMDGIKDFSLDDPKSQGYGKGAGGISSVRKGVSSSPRGIDILMNAASLIPRIGTAVKVMNAGPVADGTLDHARRMGWLR